MTGKRSAPASLGVVVLTYRDGKVAFDLLRHLLDEGIPATSVIVVQNAAAPSAQLNTPDPKIDVFSYPSNRGYSGGMNVGIRTWLDRGANAVLMLTHDARPKPGCLARLQEALRTHPGYGILAPILESDDARLPYSAGGFVDATGRIGHHEDRSRTREGVTPVDWVDGSVMLVRRAVFDAVGLLDERFFMYCDDVEFALRAASAGWRVGVVSDASAHQSSGVSRRPGAFQYLNARNGLEVARLAGGRRAVAGAVGRLAGCAWLLARSSFGPNTRPADRAEARVVLRATLWGAFDFARRKWGPPRQGLPGLGDVSVAGRGRQG